jgi:hypothetical protein
MARAPVVIYPPLRSKDRARAKLKVPRSADNEDAEKTQGNAGGLFLSLTAADYSVAAAWFKGRTVHPHLGPPNAQQSQQVSEKNRRRNAPQSKAAGEYAPTAAMANEKA